MTRYKSVTHLNDADLARITPCIHNSATALTPRLIIESGPGDTVSICLRMHSALQRTRCILSDRRALPSRLPARRSTSYLHADRHEKRDKGLRPAGTGTRWFVLDECNVSLTDLDLDEPHGKYPTSWSPVVVHWLSYRLRLLRDVLTLSRSVAHIWRRGLAVRCCGWR